MSAALILILFHKGAVLGNVSYNALVHCMFEMSPMHFSSSSLFLRKIS